jgi:RHS repeat-associated protein
VAKKLTSYSGGEPGGSQLWYYTWDQDNPSGVNNVLLEFYSPNGQGGSSIPLKTRYLDGNAVDQILAQEDVASGETLWLLQDNLGSVREVVNNDLEVVNRIVYDAFGQIESITDPANGNAPTSLVSSFGYTGQEYDIHTGLYFYSAGQPGGRWYDPRTQTFLSRDPLGLAPDVNPTRYVGNSPTNWV